MRTKSILMAVASTFLIISCGGNENQKTIKNLEKCLGNIKTAEDSSHISQEEAISIAQCMLPHLQAVKDKVDKMSRDEAEKFLKELETETEKSDYKEIIKELNYRKVKKLADSGSEKSESSNKTTKDWDRILDDYEDYVNKYVAFVRKANDDDFSANSEYYDLLQKAEDLGNQLNEAENSLNERQVLRMTKIQNKMTEVILEMED